MATDVKTESALPVKGTRDRSPAYPFISLKIAVERLAVFESYFGRHPAPAQKVGAAWGMKPDSSQAGQTLASLKSYGLVEYQGAGESRMAVLSEDGRNYLRAQQDSLKKEILKRCALKPKAIHEYWSKWGSDRLPNAMCLDELVLKGGFSETGASVFLRVYDETIGFAGLAGGDKMSFTGGDALDDSEAPTVGENEMNTSQNKPTMTPPSGAPPLSALKPAPVGMRQDTFTLDEGQAVLQWPEKLSAESFEDFESWVELQLRKIKRSIH